MRTLGSRLRALRESRSWSQEKLGFELGVTKATISKWERDQLRPGLQILLRIKSLFSDQGISLDFLGDGQLRCNACSGHSLELREHPVAAPMVVRDEQERQLLESFRAMSESRRRALLQLISEC